MTLPLVLIVPVTSLPFGRLFTKHLFLFWIGNETKA